MKVTSLRDYKESTTPVKQYEDTIRDSFVVKTSGFLTGRNIHYPNCLVETKDILLNPYDERVMSLKKDSFYDNNEWTSFQVSSHDAVIEEPMFFFVYNVDNYFHFIYDSLPILAYYFELKEKVPELKLLLSTSHPTKKSLSPFVKEFLSAIGIKDSDLCFGTKNVEYTNLYISTSFTHGQKSNDIFSPQALTVWNRCQSTLTNTPKRFYISRRSWVHGDTSNIGTNYTMRRRCMNEDDLVALLKKYDIEEVFTELLTTQQKIAYFRNAELAVGIIGGGLCNLLFSPQTTKSLCITTPHFLEINKRFSYSMETGVIRYSDSCSHAFPEMKFQLYSRVKVVEPTSKYFGSVGEVEKVDGKNYSVRLSSNDIAGFSQDFPLEEVIFEESQLEAVDLGLNSPFVCDLVKLEEDLKNLLAIQ